MKTVFARVITALVMIAGFTSCIWAGSEGEHVTEKRHVADFTSIDIKSVGSVYFTQSSDFSCTIEGEESQVKNITTSVEGNELKIGYIKKLKNNKTEKVKPEADSPAEAKERKGFFRRIGDLFKKKDKKRQEDEKD